MSEKSTVTPRRSSLYTTHYVNGCVFQYLGAIEGINEDAAVILDFLFRSTMAGEPFQVTFDDKGHRIAQEHEETLVEETLVGVAMPKHTLLTIAGIALENFSDAVVLTGEEAAAYREARKAAKVDETE